MAVLIRVQRLRGANARAALSPVPREGAGQPHSEQTVDHKETLNRTRLAVSAPTRGGAIRGRRHDAVRFHLGVDRWRRLRGRRAVGAGRGVGVGAGVGVGVGVGGRGRVGGELADLGVNLDLDARDAAQVRERVAEGQRAE